ncbi:Oligo-1,6-glucosidase (Oligosaccharide alpha-1,6-glucosidase) (Sucrase-isomaltase) (Isomaltase) (Dextrin 6-alpha-D-glucanohydrolase)[Lactobacillus casei BL23] [Lactiplantibacillus mudanjiangensis]|uniref:Oligo-1,6-glucosidase (Oligosaccharide alpha-1,6-glucosidase) (Sucrase-isomaltase) (Isomaltase) (Dextrin 6-alpha-D-glucanohydrolase)[Lactobacillus casei BL23] n=2 Tax=Lactiplantibacillus mudanjiangensis TaxID=1296538 RepID=A0A660E1G0_9LACO|nr:Oligo-1,6-glucosidase (Oligosaccharide alpha-1,6-glucosidase) (Sucrase-isomaltase) (Isomaltase) (Dextrin 6-alpha-D-glucanohydrolase)[Lactobacillus casei BL23] [Lactiplantibacillus mudanjiangensis]VDG26578.1 Oligo-1,6-glucosidase (Oligosaccharide alpha-1,6-glucosidase) (Sucrase-isomaltase) (Isomaltase) (Dextrin 6-alpha-D-glucanohydrolase)[Lactobacillus casei BL23] [Lactiplantibacillus mudanjiangensis]VDG31814.1 Oligo-1,6-glucosidase (Oligosaccharide alpha-1,6-glucosidase) (Sucrase-isomaltase) (
MMMNNQRDWWKKAVVYQVYPKSFQDSNGDGIGDLNGITQKLAYIKSLGADVVWLNPIYQSPHVDNGYDIADYYQIDADLGSMADFDRLLTTAHQLGLKLILDLVVNHTSDQHRWFQEAKSSRDNPYHDYYIWQDAVSGQVPNNWGSSFGGSTWEYVPAVDQYYLHLFAKEQPDLNWRNPQVRQAVYDIMRFWLDKGIDGFRMDVINLISKVAGFPDGPIIQNKQYGDYYVGTANGPHVHEYLQEMNEQVLSHYSVMTVGETPHTGVQDAVPYVDARRHELDMVFHFDHMHLDYGKYGKFSTNRFKLTDLKRVLSEWQTTIAEHQGWNSLYWSNHDQARAVSRFGNDSVYRVASAKMLGTLLHMLQGTPYIYEGEEIGMTNVNYRDIQSYDDIETQDVFKRLTQIENLPVQKVMEMIHCKSRDNARTPMQWNRSTNAGFSIKQPWLKVNPNYTVVNVATAQADPQSIWYYYQRLIKLRHQYDIVTTGTYQLLDPDNPLVFAYTRTTATQQLLVVCSFATHISDWAIPVSLQSKKWQPLIDNYPIVADNETANLTLQPYEAKVFLRAL